jgi:hypothetical protein
MIEYYSFDPDDGIEIHDTEAEAKARASNVLGLMRDEAGEGWHEAADQVAWGILIPVETSVQCNVVNSEDDETGRASSNGWDYICDYQLQREDLSLPPEWEADFRAEYAVRVERCREAMADIVAECRRQMDHYRKKDPGAEPLAFRRIEQTAQGCLDGMLSATPPPFPSRAPGSTGQGNPEDPPVVGQAFACGGLLWEPEMSRWRHRSFYLTRWDSGNWNAYLRDGGTAEGPSPLDALIALRKVLHIRADEMIQTAEILPEGV